MLAGSPSRSGIGCTISLPHSPAFRDGSCIYPGPRGEAPFETVRRSGDLVHTLLGGGNGPVGGGDLTLSRMSITDHLTDDGFEVFEPTAEGILRWVETTRPTPAQTDVAAHLSRLVDDGLLSEADQRRLATAGYVPPG